AVETERVLEDVPATALAVRGGDVRPGSERARREAGRARDRADATQQRQPQPVRRRLILRQPLREEHELAERDGAECVRGRRRWLDPVGAWRQRCERTVDDGELALRPDLVRAAVVTDEDAKPMVLRLGLDNARHLDAAEPEDGA